MNKVWLALALGVVIGGSYYIGRKHHDPTIKMYSDMTSQIQGHKIYLIDTPVTCPNSMVMGSDGRQHPSGGRQLGVLQVDINLQTGKLTVVKNTVPAVFTCP